MQTVEGTAEIGVGFVSGPIGPFFATMGADNVMTGLEIMWTGESQTTRLYKVINALREKIMLYGAEGAANIETVLNYTSLVNPKAYMLLEYRI